MPKTATLPNQKNPRASASLTPQQPIAYNSRWSKLQKVSARLEELAYRLGPGTQLPRVTDLCSQFEASITTVNAALGDLADRCILDRRPGVGNFVATDLHRTNILLLCNSDLLSRPELSPFWSILMKSAQQRASTNNRGFDLQFAEPPFGSQRENIPMLSETVTRLIENGRVDGAVAIGLSRETIALVQHRGFPVVSFAGPSDYAVMLHAEHLIQQGVQSLAEAGARRIALWSPMQTFVPAEETQHFQRVYLKTFQEAVVAAGLPFEDNLVQQNRHRAPLPTSVTETSYQQQGYETALSVFGGDAAVTPPDAVLSTDDMMTVGALSAFRVCGVEVSRRRSAAASGENTKLLMATHANIGSPVLIGYEDDLFLLENDPSDVVEGLFTVLEALMAGEADVSHRTLVSARLRRLDTGSSRS